MSDSSTGKKEIRTVRVSDEQVNKDIEKWAGNEMTITVEGTYTYFKGNEKLQDNVGMASTSGDETGNSSSGSAAVVDPNEQGKFNLDQVKDGMYISAKPVEKKKDPKSADKEEKEDQEK